MEQGIVVYGGIDYRQILPKAGQEADVIIWDGCNNDTLFFKPGLQVVLFDPLRLEYKLLYYAGETNILLANIAIINKVNAAWPETIEAVLQDIKIHNSSICYLVLFTTPIHLCRLLSLDKPAIRVCYEYTGWGCGLEFNY